MTTFALGINNCFAVKRWPQPEAWAAVVRRELGLGLVQLSLDLVDLGGDSGWRQEQAERAREACRTEGLTLHSAFTGLAAYSGNLLLHPEAAGRIQAERWFREVIDFTAEAGADAVGGHVGAMSVDDWRDDARRSERKRELVAALDRLSGYGRERGLATLLVENMASAREPSTTTWLRELLRPGDERHAQLRLCLDVGHECVPGQTGQERDPYYWLRTLGPVAPVVHLQQSDDSGDHHWPFTPAHNAAGRIQAEPVLEALRASGAEHVDLVLEVIPPFEADDGAVLSDLKESVRYWKTALGVA